MSIRNLDVLFKPRSIALIGASKARASMGAVLAHNLFVAGRQRLPTSPGAAGGRAGVAAGAAPDAMPNELGNVGRLLPRPVARPACVRNSVLTPARLPRATP
jgi:hypothetical protein